MITSPITSLHSQTHLVLWVHQSGSDSRGVDAATGVLVDLYGGLPTATLWISGSIEQVQDLFIVQLQGAEQAHIKAYRTSYNWYTLSARMSASAENDCAPLKTELFRSVKLISSFVFPHSSAATEVNVMTAQKPLRTRVKEVSWKLSCSHLVLNTHTYTLDHLLTINEDNLLTWKPTEKTLIARSRNADKRRKRKMDRKRFYFEIWISITVHCNLLLRCSVLSLPHTYTNTHMQ